MVRRNWFGRYGWCSYAWPALVLACALALVPLMGCAGTTGSNTGEADTPETETEEATAADAQDGAQTGDEASADASGSGDDLSGQDEVVADVVADECTDRYGDATAFALAELNGSQLQAFLAQQDYTWSARNLVWLKEDGSSAVVVFGTKGEVLTQELIEALSTGSKEAAASYRITSSRYNTPRKAFDALVGKVLTVEDSDFTDTSGVAVVQGPSQGRCLVFVNMSDGIAVVSLFGEDAVAAGLFDQLADEQMGATVDEVFESLAGHLPGAEE